MVDESTVDDLRDIWAQLRICSNVLDPLFAPSAGPMTEADARDADTVLTEFETRLRLYRRSPD